MKTLSVYWVVSNYPGAHNWQAGLFYQHLAEAVAAQGIALTVIAPVPRSVWPLTLLRRRWKQYAMAPEEAHAGGVHIVRPRYLAAPGEARRPSAARTVAAAIARRSLPAPDLVHGFGAFPVSRAATLLAQQWNVPCLTTFIGSDVNNMRADSKALFNEFLLTVSSSRQVFAVSEALASKVESLTGRTARVMYMPAKSRGFSEADRIRWRKEWEVPDDVFVLLFAGNITAAKGMPDLCAALDKLQQQSLVLMACGNPGDALNTLKQTRHAKYLGLLPHEQLLSCMSAADALVLPSYAEGIPGVIKEAGLMGLPVIATLVGGIPELLDDSNASLVEPGDVQAITKVITWHLHNREEAQEKAESLKESLSGKFDANVIADQLVAAYHAFIARDTA